MSLPTPKSALTTALLAATLAGMCTACDQASAPAPAPARDPAPTTAAAPAKGPLIEWLPAADGDLPSLVQAEMARAKDDGRILLVYVGAAWCEPCRRFHEASEKGQVAGDLPPLRMLELDLDRDADRLVAAGYQSRLIPLFVLPGPDGRATDLRMEGGIKGAGAADNIASRLRAMLARARGS